ncbi:MAG: hypothetical protein HY574_13395 [candidate division NC10 bacterium]|nr:hypothetical protein [candidate division NC10 bacterium]
MNIRLRTIGRSVIVFLALWTASAWADTLELRDGQTLTGQYAGGSKEEVRFQVGSQTLRFPLTEVSRLTIGSAAQAEFQRAARDALRQLKALASVTDGGTTYQNYSSRVEDAKIKIDQFLDEHKSSPISKFNGHITDSLGFYVAASSVWNAKVSKLNSLFYGPIFQNTYVRKCGPLQNALLRGRAERGSQQYSQDITDTVTIQFDGVPLLWECARNSMIDAEKALGR